MISGNDLVQRSMGIIRTASRPAERLGRRVVGDAVGAVQRARGRGATAGAPKDLDDVTLARKVESVVFRPEDAPKGSVSINAVDGIVYLRGEVKRPAEIRAIEGRVRAVPEVRGVENLLRTPKTPKPTRADSPRRRQAKTARQRNQTARRTTSKVSDDKTTAIVDEAEPTGRQLAAEGKGRQPAPMGSQGQVEEAGGREAPRDEAAGDEPGTGPGGTLGERTPA